MEENRKVLINKIFVGNYLHDKLNVNLKILNTSLTNNFINISKTFQSKQLELHQSCLNLEKLRDYKRNKTNKQTKNSKKSSFHKEDKKLKKLLDTSDFRSLTHTEEKESCCRKLEQDKFN